ncbi:IS3 family transposase [Enterococcus durans]|uniref:IS3 family transposase n=1 Tax=Enterococcus durans TaxID=53345 RepID=UPI003EB86E7A
MGNPSLNHRYRKGFYSLFKTLQQNQVAHVALFRYIEGFYNRKRIHSSINYLTPNQMEELTIQV